MPMSLLRRLCDAEMPCQITDAEEIDLVAVLRQAGMVEANIPPGLVEEAAYRYVGAAIVARVTPKGCDASGARRRSGPFATYQSGSWLASKSIAPTSPSVL